MKNIQQPGAGLAFLKAGAASALLLTGLSFTPVFATSEDDRNLQPIYHLYNEGQYVSTVSDQQAVEAMVDEKISQLQPQFADLKLEVDKDFSMVEEQVFERNLPHEEEAMAQAAAEVEIKASAFALSINGRETVQVKDQAAYDEMIRQVKLAYATPEELAAWEQRKGINEALPELQPGQANILSLTIAENLSGAANQTKPSLVMQPEQAAKYLLTGERSYTVHEGDKAEELAAIFGMELEELTALNPGIDLGKMAPGTQLNVSEAGPLVTVQVKKQQKQIALIPHKSLQTDDPTLLKGQSKLKQQGKNGRKHVTAEVETVNGEQVSHTVLNEQATLQPIDHIVLNGTMEPPSVGAGTFMWPAEGGRITSKRGQRWGRLHNGIDIAHPSGPAIKSADHGIVKAAGAAGTFGNRVIVDHQNGYETIYAHLSSIDVKVGEVVPQGTKLGDMGNTGRSTGVHLHFEVSLNGVTQDPLKYIN
ncbi:peptidoglycan DD-metalloendopeptidase family protein [Planococcus sp. 1R117A]|uniref:peptidoglycan DD-metalloendopeptidase family protein n=1 Tax=Planococcus sp. 1R117A TaxID=3447020 RepID=UPI003EDCA037